VITFFNVLTLRVIVVIVEIIIHIIYPIIEPIFDEPFYVSGRKPVPHQNDMESSMLGYVSRWFGNHS